LINQGWKDGVIGSITPLNQAHYAFILNETTEVDLNQIIDHWCIDSYGDSQFCINSLVLSKLNGSQWQSVAVDAPKFLFYQDIEEYWGEVSDELLQYFDDMPYHLQSGLTKIVSEIVISLKANFTPFSSSNWIGTYEEIEINFTKTQFPTHYINWCFSV
jgi:hypothetical protein